MKEIEELVEGCEHTEFPQLRHDFSDTLIYWRGDCKRPAVKENGTEGASNDDLEKTAEPEPAEAASTNAALEGTAEVPIDLKSGAYVEPTPEGTASESVLSSEETRQS